ncbi:kinase-like domain-containing protein [Jimgerdemannia flammicorona]|uniref:Kinase-like domain-containing protein n=1 Tax=Jimgerdemannia flammicorona TaxID=994334 RepID=A0A433AVN0_9FUNG|nr:kinase-like domain-containing protein [Jimgerdemannia flammicorona]
MDTQILTMQFTRFQAACASETNGRRRATLTREHHRALALKLFCSKTWYDKYEHLYNTWQATNKLREPSSSTHKPQPVTSDQLKDALNVVKHLFEKELTTTTTTPTTTTTIPNPITTFPNYIALDALTLTPTVLGEGGCGKVIIAHYGGLQVACKRFHTEGEGSGSSSSFGSGIGDDGGSGSEGDDGLDDFAADDEVDKDDPLWEFKRELIFAVKVAPCRFVNKYLGAFAVPPGYKNMEEGVFVVQTFFERGDLRSFMAEKDRLLHPLEVLQLAISLFTAIVDCHRLDIGLLDVKIENILVDSSGSAWVTDLGSFINLKGREWVNLDLVAVRWTRDVAAPEMLKSRRARFGKPSDVFMAVRVLAETMTANLDDVEFGHRVIRRRRDPEGHVNVYPLAFHPCYQGPLVDLIVRGLANDPRHRPSAEEMLQSLREVREYVVARALDAAGLPAGKTGRSPKAMKRWEGGKKGKRGRPRKDVGKMEVEEVGKMEVEKVRKMEAEEVGKKRKMKINEEIVYLADETAEEEWEKQESMGASETPTEDDDENDGNYHASAAAIAAVASVNAALDYEGVMTRRQRRASLSEKFAAGARAFPYMPVTRAAPKTRIAQGRGRGRGRVLRAFGLVVEQHEEGGFGKGRRTRREISEEAEFVVKRRKVMKNERGSKEETWVPDVVGRITRGRSRREEGEMRQLRMGNGRGKENR